MPPTAVELKARLDKAVDQEGNVLDMEAALQIVTYLERNAITKESLETTRIGRTINLMRKKTTNEDLARRAKKLVKKWQTLVSKHLKKKKVESPLPAQTTLVSNHLKKKKAESTLPAQTTLVSNHLKKKKAELPLPAQTTLVSNHLKKKKAESPVPVHNRNGIIRKDHTSPKLEKSHAVKVKERPRSRCPTPNTEHLQKTLKRKRTSGGESFNLKAGLSQKKASPSPGIHIPKTKFIKTSELIRPISPLTLNHCKITSPTSVKHVDNLNNERLQGEPEQIIKTSPDSTSVVTSSTTTVENGHSEVDIIITKPTDTRCQEDRIKPEDACQTEKAVVKCKSDEKEEPEQTRTFTPIEEEDLSVSRKELPEEFLSPEIKADGINGVYNSQGDWASWTDTIPERENNLHLLPYIILD